uniref:C2H2-type domain-containing protein n=1 Tax=Leptobrachium leishanense TaxID=445787 RepID=A0A8C5WCV2_9ANUR
MEGHVLRQAVHGQISPDGHKRPLRPPECLVEDILLKQSDDHNINAEGVSVENAVVLDDGDSREGLAESSDGSQEDPELGCSTLMEDDDDVDEDAVPDSYDSRANSEDEDNEIICKKLTDADTEGMQTLETSCDDPGEAPLISGGVAGHITSSQKSHREDKSFICSECGMFFDRYSNLVRHQRVHTGERPFVCTECNKSYTQSAHLTRHQKSHTAVKTYPCRDCGYRFAHKAQLEIHRKAHRGRTQYACAVCGKCFIKYPNLLAHQQVHLQPKPEPKFFHCSLCEEKFIHKSDLAKHERGHTGEKFLCFKCGIRFSCSSSLHRHQKFLCFKCGIRFSCSSSLHRHQKIHCVGTMAE